MCHLHFVVQVLSFWFDSFFIQRSMAVASSLRTFSSFLFLFFFWPLFPVLRFHSFSLRRPKNKRTSRTTIWTGARSEKSSSGLFLGGFWSCFVLLFFSFIRHGRAFCQPVRVDCTVSPFAVAETTRSVSTRPFNRRHSLRRRFCVVLSFVSPLFCGSSGPWTHAATPFPPLLKKNSVKPGKLFPWPDL